MDEVVDRVREVGVSALVGVSTLGVGVAFFDVGVSFRTGGVSLRVGVSLLVGVFRLEFVPNFSCKLETLYN